MGKQTLSCGLAAILMYLFLTGCMPSEPEPTTDISFLIGSASATTEMNINRTAVVEAAGGEILMHSGSRTASGTVDMVAELIEAGCDGIILTPSSEEILPKISRICEEAGVYWVLSMRPVNSLDILHTIESSPYYVGMVKEDDEAAGYGIIETIAQDDEVNKVATLSVSKLNPAGEARERGMFRAARDYNVKIVAEVRNLSSENDLTNVVPALMSVHPDLDVIFNVASSGGPQGKITILDSIRDGQYAVKFASIDCHLDMAPYFEEEVVVAAGGHLALDSILATALLVNAVTGHPIGDDGPVTLTVPYIMVQDRQTLEILCANEDIPLCSQEEIRRYLLKENRAELNPKACQQIIDFYTSGGLTLFDPAVE